MKDKRLYFLLFSMLLVTICFIKSTPMVKADDLCNKDLYCEEYSFANQTPAPTDAEETQTEITVTTQEGSNGLIAGSIIIVIIIIGGVVWHGIRRKKR